MGWYTGDGTILQHYSTTLFCRWYTGDCTILQHYSTTLFCRWYTGDGTILQHYSTTLFCRWYTGDGTILQQNNNISSIAVVGRQKHLYIHIVYTLYILLLAFNNNNNISFLLQLACPCKWCVFNLSK